MLDLADRAYAPRNVQRSAAAGLDGRLFIARRKRQQGLLEIARRASHGTSRSCPRCSEANGDDADAELLSAFGIRDHTTVARIMRLVGPGALLRTARSR